MTPEEYQSTALRTLIEQDTDSTIKMCALGLSGELGEIISIPLQSSERFQRKEKLLDEMGDMLWYTVVMGDCIGSSFSQLLRVSYDPLNRQYMTSEYLAIPVGRINDVLKKHYYHRKNSAFPTGLIEQALAEIVERLSWTARYTLDISLMDVAAHNAEKLAKRHGASFKPVYISDSVKE